jgi:murein DD-endopeptidase MepM/ murein hydrolase activator NlpD
VKPVKSYRLSSPFGVRQDPLGRGTRMHNGLDFAADTGTPVRALADGTVVAAGPAGGYGIQVTVRHDDGTESSYAHLSKILVAGGKVRAGEAIGEVGSTGNSTGPHLHLEVRVGDVPQDPAAWLRDKGVEV